MASDRLRVPGTWFRVRASLPREAEDLVLGALHRAGSTGSATQPAGPRRVACEAWFESAAAADAGCEALRGIAGVRLAEGRPEAVRDDGWLEASERPRPPLLAGRFALLDRRPATPLPAGTLGGRELLVIPASRAFGTGEHPTTQLCLELLSERVRPGDDWLDLGTGSGILAIAALRLGAAHAVAIDHDPQALLAARENAARNGVSPGLQILSDQDPQPRPAAVLVANILAGTLVELAPRIAALVAPGGRLALAGILADQADDVIAAYADGDRATSGPVDLSIGAARDGWVLLCGTRA